MELWMSYADRQFGNANSMDGMLNPYLKSYFKSHIQEINQVY